MSTVDLGVDSALMRRAMGQFATGVTVITTVAPDGTPAGCTVSAFCSLSLDPPLVLVCIGKDRYLHSLLADGPGYAVNVLAADQRDVASRFARPNADRFARLPVREGRHGIPLIEGTLAQIECDRHSLLDGGDHSIVIGRVRQIALREAEPLLYSQGSFVDMPDQDWERMLSTAPQEWLLSAPW